METLHNVASALPSATVERTPVEIRTRFAKVQQDFLASGHKRDEHIECAREILAMLATHKWLHDQIAWDVLGIARSAAKESTTLDKALAPVVA